MCNEFQSMSTGPAQNVQRAMAQQQTYSLVLIKMKSHDFYFEWKEVSVLNQFDGSSEPVVTFISDKWIYLVVRHAVTISIAYDWFIQRDDECC